MRKALLVATLAVAGPLAGCASITEAVKGPSMAPMGYPSALLAQDQGVMPLAASGREPLPHPASPNSLWRTGARAFFNDQRASRVGDILTVQININDTAKTSNATNATRSSTDTAGVKNLFGLESTLGRILPKSFSPTNALNTTTSLASNGSGGVTRQEQISLTIAAVVTQVLPNGNLVIQGRQEVETNNDVRELTVAGIVRPEDISNTNTIQHTQIAEARIFYGGRGDVSAVQKTPSGTALMQRFLPF
jgi:flagellar L-ring protein precursor FlgH